MRIWENVSQKEVVENWSEKTRQVITTEDNGDSSLEDFHDTYEVSPRGWGKDKKFP